MEAKHGGKFMNGFFWGMVFGALLFFLFGTKRGRKILKNLSEEGIDVFENLENMESQDEYEDDVEESPRENGINHKQESTQTKRFFKGIKKR